MTAPKFDNTFGWRDIITGLLFLIAVSAFYFQSNQDHEVIENKVKPHLENYKDEIKRIAKEEISHVEAVNDEKFKRLMDKLEDIERKIDKK